MDENALICSSDFRGGEMRLFRCLICLAASLLFVAGAVGQNPNVKHFDKDGLSFDYPANWQFSDQSTQQMQFLELSQGDVVIRVRSPREWLKTPEKEAHAKKIFQDQYVDNFDPERSSLRALPFPASSTTRAASARELRRRLDSVQGTASAAYSDR